MKALLLDTETTGLNPDTDRCIEIAVMLYDLDHATALESFASLLPSDSNAAEKINRIPVAALRAVDIPAAQTWRRVDAFASRADVIIAHRAEFDRGFVPAALRDSKSWVCSKFDIVWPKAEKMGEGLVSLALAHDLGVAVAHRAMADVDILSRLFTRTYELGVNLPEMVRHAMRPKALFEVSNKGFSYELNDTYKKHSFRWSSPTRSWRRTLARDDASKLPFEVIEVAQPLPDGEEKQMQMVQIEMQAEVSEKTPADLAVRRD